MARNMEKEKNCDNQPISLNRFRTISKRASKGVCIVKVGDEKVGTGFLTQYIKDKEKIYGFVTCYHVLHGRKKYMTTLLFPDSEKRITIDILDKLQIERDDKDDLDFVFYQIDIWTVAEWQHQGLVFVECVMPVSNMFPVVFVLQHPGASSNVKFHQGSIKSWDMNGNAFIHSVSTDKGSSGSPVLNYEGKVIGVHRGALKHGEGNYGTTLWALLNCDSVYRVPVNPLDEFFGM